MPPEQKKQVRDQFVKKVTREKKVWQIILKSEWLGETIKQPMNATYVGELKFGAKTVSKLLDSRTTDQLAQWEVKTEFTPLGIRIRAFEILYLIGYELKQVDAA